MRVFTVFPLMIIPVIIYNVLALGGNAFTSVDALRERLDTDFMSVHMASGVPWDITPGHALICLLYTSPSPRDKRQSRMPSSA